MTETLRWDIFCRVIDNHGDLGVCWRLARDLASRGHVVRLWVDDPVALDWMAPQGCAGVQIVRWDEPGVEQTVAALPPDPHQAVGDVVVEAFGCDPPPAFVARMAARQPAPVWINLEYLSAEAYVERSHGLASPQWRGPGAGLTKWFFYPGFTAATGGLLREPDLLTRRDGWVAAAEPGAPAPEVLLFCYDNPVLPAWLDALSAAGEPVRLLLTPGFATRQAQAWIDAADHPGQAGPAAPRGGLTLHYLSHVSQPEFDHLLWRSELNLVRGEDSLVRAIWAGRPFVWQIYPQHDGAHAIKLEAFLDRYLMGADPALAGSLRWFFRAWNGTAPWDAARWHVLWSEQRPVWRSWAAQWCEDLSMPTDLVTQLLHFVASRAGRLK